MADIISDAKYMKLPQEKEFVKNTEEILAKFGYDAEDYKKLKNELKDMGITYQYNSQYKRYQPAFDALKESKQISGGQETFGGIPISSVLSDGMNAYGDAVKSLIYLKNGFINEEGKTLDDAEKFDSLKKLGIVSPKVQKLTERKMGAGGFEDTETTYGINEEALNALNKIDPTASLNAYKSIGNKNASLSMEGSEVVQRGDNKQNNIIENFALFDEDIVKSKKYGDVFSSYINISRPEDLREGELDFVLDKAKQGLSIEDLSREIERGSIGEGATTGTVPTPGEPTTPGVGTTTPGQDVQLTPDQQTRQSVRDIVTDMGYDLSEQGLTELEDHFVNLSQDPDYPDLDAYTMRQIISGEPGYGEQKTAEYREEVGKQTARQGEEFLQKRALPRLEQTFNRLGGKGRASAEAAAGYAAADIGKARQETLSNIGVQDSLQSIMNTYNQSVRANNDLMNQYYSNQQFSQQQYGNRVQQQQLRTQNIIGERQRKEDRATSLNLANMQRNWQLQDIESQRKAQKSQNIWSLIGGIGGQALGTVGGAWAYNKFLK